MPIGRVVSPVEPVFGPQEPSIFTLDGRSYWRNRFTIRRFPERVTPLPLPAPLPRLALPSTQAAPVQEPVVTVEEPEEPVVTVEPVDPVIRIPRSAPVPAPASLAALRPSHTIQRIRRERGEAAE